jgi:hypothetical protein
MKLNYKALTKLVRSAEEKTGVSIDQVKIIDIDKVADPVRDKGRWDLSMSYPLDGSFVLSVYVTPDAKIDKPVLRAAIFHEMGHASDTKALTLLEAMPAFNTISAIASIKDALTQNPESAHAWLIGEYGSLDKAQLEIQKSQDQIMPFYNQIKAYLHLSDLEIFSRLEANPGWFQAIFSANLDKQSPTAKYDAQTEPETGVIDGLPKIDGAAVQSLYFSSLRALEYAADRFALDKGIDPESLFLSVYEKHPSSRPPEERAHPASDRRIAMGIAYLQEVGRGDEVPAHRVEALFEEMKEPDARALARESRSAIKNWGAMSMMVRQSSDKIRDALGLQHKAGVFDLDADVSMSDTQKIYDYLKDSAVHELDEIDYQHDGLDVLDLFNLMQENKKLQNGLSTLESSWTPYLDKNANGRVELGEVRQVLKDHKIALHSLDTNQDDTIDGHELSDTLRKIVLDNALAKPQR